MTRQQLEHLIRAAAVIADDDEIVIVGSQAILGRYPDAPAALLMSVEADLYPKNHPDRADLIDGTLGELSPFHDTYGYYAQGVGPTTAILPDGWENRLIPIRNENTRWATLAERLPRMPLGEAHRDLVAGRIARDFTADSS